MCYTQLEDSFLLEFQEKGKVFRESDIVDCDIGNLTQEPLEKQLQKQCQQLEAKLKEQNEQLETKMNEQSEQLKEQSEQLETKLKGQLEVKLNEHSEKLSEQFQEAVRQLSECHKVYTITVL